MNCQFAAKAAGRRANRFRSEAIFVPDLKGHAVYRWWKACASRSPDQFKARQEQRFPFMSATEVVGEIDGSERRDGNIWRIQDRRETREPCRGFDQRDDWNSYSDMRSQGRDIRRKIPTWAA